MRVELKSLGDYWINWREVARQIIKTPDSCEIVLDKMHEGWSLQSSGAYDFISKIMHKHGRSITDVTVIDPNYCERHLFQKNLNTQTISHFFDMAKYTYWQDLPVMQPTAARFGYFVGRSTMPRILMFYHIEKKQWSQHFFMSKLQEIDLSYSGLWNHRGFYLDRVCDWTSDPEDFLCWIKQWKPHSVDGFTVTDQFKPGCNTNLSLLRLSGNWHIELVFETCTQGPSYLPTEKTVRPLVCEKPCLIYGPRGFLQNLRNQGFHTWGDIWDESYDDYEQKTRYDMIKDVINTLISMTSGQFKHAMAQAQIISQHNKKHLANMIDAV